MSQRFDLYVFLIMRDVPDSVSLSAVLWKTQVYGNKTQLIHIYIILYVCVCNCVRP